jgi:HlyD family secretion protein
MHPNPKIMIPVLAVIVLSLIVGAYFVQRQSTSSGLTISGTIEATEIHLGAEIGGRVSQIAVKEGESVQTGQVLVEIKSGGTVKSPIDGVVLERVVEPGEVVTPGSVLLILGDLQNLTLTVYVPEDRYGQIKLGQTYPVTVDSFPGETFYGKVSHIADQAEFTPRNVQTIDNRKTTVYAIKLDLPPAGGKLKPGMPADVHFAPGQ